MALANAGHPAPYLNGTEIPIAGTLPLGLSATTVYTQMNVDMHSGDRAILLTDGIPEARNEGGTLLGFPRVESLVRAGATVRTVADAAQQYGQNDDITVISVARET